MIREESSYDPKTLSPVGARGLMQLMPDTARLVARAIGEAYNSDPATLHEVRLNIRLGTRYLATLMKQFGEPALVAAGYNAGPHRVVRWWGGRRNDDLEEWIEAIPFDETRAFVKRVLTSWEEYRRLSQTRRSLPDQGGLKRRSAFSEPIRSAASRGSWRSHTRTRSRISGRFSH